MSERPGAAAFRAAVDELRRHARSEGLAKCTSEAGDELVARLCDLYNAALARGEREHRRALSGDLGEQARREAVEAQQASEKAMVPDPNLPPPDVRATKRLAVALADKVIQIPEDSVWTPKGLSILRDLDHQLARTKLLADMLAPKELSEHEKERQRRYLKGEGSTDWPFP